MLKTTSKNLGILLYFIIGQMIGTIGIYLYKTITDEAFVDKLIDCIDIDTMQINTGNYVNVLSEMLMPCIILADILLIVPIVIHIVQLKKKDKNCKIVSLISKKETILCIGIGLAINIITSGLIDLIPYTSTNKLYKFVEQLTISNNLFIDLLAVGILAPIMEELIFRYALIEINKKKSIKFAIVISALAFGIAHFNIVQSSYAFIIGLFLGYIYVKTNNLVYSILIHMTVNSSSVIYGYLSNQLQQLSLFLAIVFSAISIYCCLKGNDILDKLTNKEIKLEGEY